MPVDSDKSLEDLDFSQQLLLGVAEELKMPLMQIAHLAEMTAKSADDITSFRAIQSTADTGLQLIDNYILGIRLKTEPQLFELESVSVSSVLYDTGEKLRVLAKSYGVHLELSIGGRFAPVTANKEALQAALVSLGAALIEAIPALDGSMDRQLCLQLATHKSRYGIVAGLYSDVSQLSSSLLSSGRKLSRTSSSRQPLINLTHTSGAGVFVAETILNAMDLKLTASRHRNLYGIATILKTNNQLQLV
jgi:hypothetical protein